MNLTTALDTRMFFWRTVQRQEVDLVEELAGGMRAYEIKWSQAKAMKGISKTFSGAYPEAECQCVTPQNYVSFLHAVEVGA